MATVVTGDEVIAQRGDEYLATKAGAPYFGRLVNVKTRLAFDPVFVPGVLAEEGWEALDGVEGKDWDALTEAVLDVPAPPPLAEAYEELGAAWARAEAVTAQVKDYRVLTDTKGLLAIGTPEALAAFEVKAQGEDDVVELELTEEEFWANQDWLREVRRLRQQGGTLDTPDDPQAAAEAQAARQNALAEQRARRSLAALKEVELRYGVKVDQPDPKGTDDA